MYRVDSGVSIPFICGYCRRVFHTAEALQVHLGKAHGKALGRRPPKRGGR